MTKREFLEIMAAAFLAKYPLWSVIYEEKQLAKYLGLEFPGKTLVWISFSCRPDNMRVHHGVGWSRDKISLLKHLTGNDRTPKPRDGSLHRLRKLERPRDFSYDCFDVSIRLLHKPIDGFDLARETLDSIRATMLQEIEEYAFPYLCMMLQARHDVHVTPSELGAG